MISYFPASTIIDLIQGACSAGEASVHSVAQALLRSNSLKGNADTLLTKMKEFCDAETLPARTGYWTGVGAVICMVAEVILLVAVASNYFAARDCQRKKPKDQKASTADEASLMDG